MQRAARAELGNGLKRRPLGGRVYRMELRLVARGKHREQPEPARLIGPRGGCGGSDVRLQERRGLEQRHLTGRGSCILGFSTKNKKQKNKKIGSTNDRVACVMGGNPGSTVQVEPAGNWVSHQPITPPTRPDSEPLVADAKTWLAMEIKG